MKVALTLGITLLATFSSPCLNDRDSRVISEESRITKADSKALVGWFDRFPKQYYQMRIDRLKKQPTLTPNEFDDLSVAYDRIGESRQAIKAIAPKLKLTNLTKDDQYSYYANHGTFLAHAWFKEGRNPANTAELDQAIKEIAKAIELNPKAHNGREGTQLEVLRWVRNLGKPDSEKNPRQSLGEFLAEKLPNEAEVGLKGLIMQGNAWESPDVAAALALVSTDKTTITLAKYRFEELIAAGMKPIDEVLAYSDIQDAQKRFIKDGFKNLRKAADKRMAYKTAFMQAKMIKGEHPDTHSDFWNSWTEPRFEPVTTRSFSSYISPNNLLQYGLLAALVTLLLGGTYIVVTKHRERKRAKLSGNLRT